MTVWLLAPTIRPDADRVFAYWQAAGYRVAVLVDGEAPRPRNCDWAVAAAVYEGYGASINRLWRDVAGGADIVIAGSDDLYPCEQFTAGELASQFFDRFPDGFGAMHLAARDLSDGQSTDHLWFGHDYARRINRGRGPIWPGYGHYFDDTEAGLVAEKLGVLWRRPELGQRHDHWTLHGNGRPPHLERAGGRWAASKALFERRKAEGFPGSEAAA